MKNKIFYTAIYTVYKTVKRDYHEYCADGGKSAVNIQIERVGIAVSRRIDTLVQHYRRSENEKKQQTEKNLADIKSDFVKLSYAAD